MARLVYACRFEVSAAEGLDPAFGEYRNWLVSYYQERHGLVNFKFDPSQVSQPSELPDGHDLSWKNYFSEKGSVAQILWSFPHDGDQGLRWLNDVRIGRFGDRCSIEHQIFIESIEYNISPAQMPVGSPRVVRDLCINSKAYIGDISEIEVKAIPYPVHTDTLTRFLKLLLHENRRIPIIFLSPYAHGETNRIDAKQLAKNLAGVAIVVHVDNSEVTWGLTNAVGRQMSCFNGAARIYWPGFSLEDAPQNHRLFLSSKIEEVGPLSVSRMIERAVFTVAALRFVKDPRVSEVIREVDTIERQKRFEAQKASKDETWATYAQELDKELDVKNQRITELETENKVLKENQRILLTADYFPDEEKGENDDTENEIMSIESVAMALQKAEQKTKNLEILPSAFSSAKESQFQRPQEIYDALHDLDEYVNDWHNGEIKGLTLVKYLRNHGWNRTRMRISQTTKGKYRHHYEFVYQGKKRLFESHITVGARDFNTCASIHFLFDKNRKKIIVAHCGKHLRNMST